MKTIRVVVAALMCAVSMFAQTNEKPPTTRPALSPREIVERVSRSLVLIITEDPDGEAISQGSGFFIKGDLVATNLHVFKRASKGYVKLISTGITYKIDWIVGMDVEHDLCVFRVSAVSVTALPLALMSILAIGDEVYVGGNPRGLEGSFSKGIVSAIRLEQGAIQIDAAISPGSSGGPVVNNRAEAIGVAASTLRGGQNLNFAVPVSYLARLPLIWQAPVFVAGAFALTDRDKDQLKGPVRSVTERIAYYDYLTRSDRLVEGPSRLSRVTTYDHAGNETGHSEYDERGALSMKFSTEYDRQGLMTRGTDWGLADKTAEHVKEFTREEAVNFKVDQRHFSITDRDERVDRTTGKKFILISSTYDRHGNLTEHTTMPSGPTGPETKTIYAYDRNGNSTETKNYKNGVLDSSYRYEYELDDWGNWVKSYEQIMRSNAAHLGFNPVVVTYREITYYPN